MSDEKNLNEENNESVNNEEQTPVETEETTAEQAEETAETPAETEETLAETAETPVETEVSERSKGRTEKGRQRRTYRYNRSCGNRCCNSCRTCS